MRRDASRAGRGSDKPGGRRERIGPMGRNRIKIDLLIHDLKVPLSVIEAGLVSMLTREEKYGPLTDKQKKVLKRVLRNTRRTITLVNDALELGRSREGRLNLTSFQLSNLIEQSLVEIFDYADSNTAERIRACKDLRTLKAELARKGLKLDIEEPLWCRQYTLDQPKVTQILRNLLTNALKYKRNEVRLWIGEEDGFLCISVRDDGEGIPEMYHERIFECYFQMDQTGSCPVRGHGLGLAGVLILVEDMGGTLTLESGQGRGAEFSVKIPLAPPRS